MKRRYVLLALANLTLFTGVAFAWARPEAKGPAITVPFELLPSNHMVLNAKINGKGPFRLVFDVGAPVTLLSNKAGEESAKSLVLFSVLCVSEPRLREDA